MQEVGEAHMRPWLAWLSVSIVAPAVAAVVISTTVRATDSDMMRSLLAAESLVQGNWLRFDHYPDLVKSALQVGYRLEEVNGHLYYFFPIGTSLLVAPAIAVLSLLGIEVTPKDDKIQIAFAAIASVVVFLLVYFLARRFLRHWMSLLIAMGLNGRVQIPVDTYGPQQVEVSVNGTPVTTSVVEGMPGQQSPGRLTVMVDPALLRPGVNEVALSLPTRVTVGKVSDLREIAIAMKGFSLS